MKIKLTGYSEQTRMDLENISATKDEKISATKNTDISATKLSDTKLSATDNVSATDITVSDTDNVSATDSRGKYQNEWKRKNRDTIRFDVKKGTKSFLLNEASKRGISLTQMIKDALKLYLSTN